MQLVAVLFGLTLIVPALVWAQSGRWRVALKAWRQSVAVLAALAIPGAFAALFLI